MSRAKNCLMTESTQALFCLRKQVKVIVSILVQ